ncbi:Uncharacterised protein [Mycobacterium tuberculosis]|nr:Uncharacterised protein [Mycobacterium tuberculosis]COY55340.1 Uncharacterised protein [Mycobacterium tuberculosis]
MTSSASTFSARTRSQVRPASDRACASVLWATIAPRACPCGATDSGELARIPACTPAQCSEFDHRAGLPSESSSVSA